MALETVRVRSDRLTMDLLVWRHFKRQDPGLVEQVLALNPGLSAGVFLPLGADVVLPVLAPVTAPPVRPLTNLWD